VEPAPYLEDLCKKELVYRAPGKELNWWGPTPDALLALGLRSYTDIPELKALERYFDSGKSFQTASEQHPIAPAVTSLFSRAASSVAPRLEDNRTRPITLNLSFAHVCLAFSFPSGRSLQSRLARTTLARARLP
jgi:hypothetical protein